MTFKFANRISALVTTAVGAADTTVTLETGAGSKFPALSQPGDVCQGAIIAATGAVEIMQVTAVTGDVLTVLRAREGTAAGSFPIGSRFELRVTTSVLDSFLQRSGGTMTGALNMNNKKLQNVDFDDILLFNQLHATVIRATDRPLDGSVQADENAIYMPPANGLPQIQFAPILTALFFRQMVFSWYGDINNVPYYLKLCDGTNGTPDMRGKFVKGWLPTFGVGGYGGASLAVTDARGAHGHTLNIIGHAITEAELPGWPTRDAATGGGKVKGAFPDRPAAEHGHPGSYVDGVGDHQHLVATEPEYFVLAYVMLNI
jgi:hypothetical protein